MNKSWLVYLLSCSDGTLYCGVTRQLERRLAQHNGLLPGGARYTAGRRPVRILGAVDCPSKSDALRLEIRVKQMPRSRKMEFFTEEGCPRLR